MSRYPADVAAVCGVLPVCGSADKRHVDWLLQRVNERGSDVDLQSLILVVDDDADLRKLMAEFLVGHRYGVLMAPNVAEMQQLSAAGNCNLVVPCSTS